MKTSMYSWIPDLFIHILSPDHVTSLLTRCLYLDDTLIAKHPLVSHDHWRENILVRGCVQQTWVTIISCLKWISFTEKNTAFYCNHKLSALSDQLCLNNRWKSSLSDVTQILTGVFRPQPDLPTLCQIIKSKRSINKEKISIWNVCQLQKVYWLLKALTFAESLAFTESSALAKSLILNIWHMKNCHIWQRCHLQIILVNKTGISVAPRKGLMSSNN